MYTVEFAYDIPEWGATELEASDIEQAEAFALEYVKDTYDDVKNIEITSIKELKL